MQKFTRALTREIEVGGERLAITLSEQGLSVRVVGTRKQPLEMTWAACMVACTKGAPQPSDEEIAACVKAIRAGAKEPPKEEAAATEASHAEPQEAPEEEEADEEEAEPPAKNNQHVADTKDRLPELLKQLDAWLVKHRQRFAKGLLPPATPEELKALEGELGHALPEELRVWLTWHNGQSPDVAGAFLENWHLQSTHQIADVKKDLDAEKAPNWKPDWIPFLDDDNDNYVCVDSKQPGHPVLECWRDKQEPIKSANSLATWVEQLLHGLEKGQYAEDSERGSFSLKSEK